MELMNLQSMEVRIFINQSWVEGTAIILQSIVISLLLTTSYGGGLKIRKKILEKLPSYKVFFRYEKKFYTISLPLTHIHKHKIYE